MQFKTLENLTTATITQLFNKTFADYFVKIERTPDFMQRKIDSEGIFSGGNHFGTHFYYINMAWKIF